MKSGVRYCTLIRRVLIKKTSTSWLNYGSGVLLTALRPSPVAVHWALIHLDRCPLTVQQAGRGRLQLCPQTAHTGVCLKRVWPSLRVLVHHLQQIADCRLSGSVRPLLIIHMRTRSAWPLMTKDMEVRKCAQPSRSPSQCSATCWQVLPPPPNLCKLTEGVLQKLTFQQLIFERIYYRRPHPGKNIHTSHLILKYCTHQCFPLWKLSWLWLYHLRPNLKGALKK